MLLYEIVQCGRDGRVLRSGSFHVQSQSCIFGGWAVARPERTDGNLFLLEIREVFQQSLYTRGAEENQHVVIELLVALEIVAHGAVHYHFLVG